MFNTKDKVEDIFSVGKPNDKASAENKKASDEVWNWVAREHLSWEIISV